MFSTIKQVFLPQNKDILKKIKFTLLVLLLFKIGTYITVPGAKSITNDLGFLEILNMMNGGALEKFSVFALGVSPYITASIITQLLQMDIIPYFSELKHQGEEGRSKINKINRYLGIGLAFINAYFFSFAYMKGISTINLMTISLIMTAGTAFLLWLGDQISSKGIGNGVSLFIMAGSVSSLPSMFTSAWKGLVVFTTTYSTIISLLSFAAFVLIYILLIIGVIFVNEAERRIPVQYANKSSSSYGNNQSHLPFKLNSAGVMPVIFASIMLTIPAIISGMIKNAGFTKIVENYLTFNKPVGFAIYLLLILFFSYFYTYIQIRPEELSKNLKENNGFIPGIRPGIDTSKYISKVLSKLTILGSIFLMIIAGLPIIFNNVANLGTNINIGGTGLLIVVGVALETYRQIESSLVSRNYKRRY